MTQTIELPKLRTFDLLSPSEQSAIRRHCQNVVALALRRKYGTVAEHVPDPDVAHMPEPTPRKFTRWQLESGFADYPEPKRDRTPAQQATFYNQLNTRRQREDAAKPGPRTTPKPSRKGERMRPDRPAIARTPSIVAPPSTIQQIKNILTEHGPQTNAQIAEKLGWTMIGAAKSVSARTVQLIARGEIVKHAEFNIDEGHAVHVYAMLGTSPDAAYTKPAPKRRKKTRPEVVRPIRKIKVKPERDPSMPERAYALLLEHGQMTNAELGERLGLGTHRDVQRRVSTMTSMMHKRGQIEVVGTFKKKGSIPMNIYAATVIQPEKRYKKGDTITGLAEWLKNEGTKTAEQIAEYLGPTTDHRSTITRILRYGMAHVCGKVPSDILGRPHNLYAYGPEPRGRNHDQ